MGFTTASSLSNYTALVEVAAAALGGKNGGKGKPTEDLSNASPEQFAARVGDMLSI